MYVRLTRSPLREMKMTFSTKLWTVSIESNVFKIEHVSQKLTNLDPFVSLISVKVVHVSYVF